MADEWHVEQLVAVMRQRGKSLDEAFAYLAPGVKDTDLLEEARAHLEEMQQRTRMLENPPGVSRDHELAQEAKLDAWYTGPDDTDATWQALRRGMVNGGLKDAFTTVDLTSTAVVAHLASPSIHRLKKKGLVLGHVQSGKTANYAAVVAKAADAGYGLVVVLAGMHNNLRRQTQRRLDRDVRTHEWVPLTDETRDFGHITSGAALMAKRQKMLAVVKKNPSRLKRLLDFLRDVPEDIRVRYPILIIDDEADQATPNTMAARQRMSAINKLLREIWKEVPTGSYVGYTATPFANVFMDPDDDDDFFPEDFIINLPRSNDYFGAERLFGRRIPDDAGQPDSGLDVVRDVPADEEERLSVTQANKGEFEPEVTPSLDAALRWFLLARAARRARGQANAHTSMLVHTTHFVEPHFAMKRVIDDALKGYHDEVANGDLENFLSLWEDERDRAKEVATLPLPETDAVMTELLVALAEVRVVVDNGYSKDRLDYSETDADGNPVVQTVIAVGGGTLSRGLTLEGLVVSFFTRTSSTYDTLLQMGRWFGYRPGYEDLPRIWMPQDLAEEFSFLSDVEAELREQVDELAGTSASPKQVGVRVRNHPGRLSITAANKMVHARQVSASLSGALQQTIVLHETDDEVLRANRKAVEGLVAAHAWDRRSAHATTWIARGLGVPDLVRFLDAYTFHDKQVGLKPALVKSWLNGVGLATTWNVAVVGLDGEGTDDLLELGGKVQIRPVRRAPLKTSPVGTANIKALVSRSDLLIDLEVEGAPTLDQKEVKALRRKQLPGTGLLLIYPIDSSSPARENANKPASRRTMQAPEALFGLALLYPEVDDSGWGGDAEYFSVRESWELPSEQETAESEGSDDEGDLSIDGEALARA